ncbi:uncharacterized protein BO97DRAFT_405643 [Aspergillus homomorphus CBS 101889]|uniref:Uncharacterized protein n=1 Tax=Aspergillus homomorphus (strain CBS 101889) TaxID=1450537 RepID=A0A395HWL5_ASPHC|nr:hypothetical protein BO97DRAFT_405643 [Aspergillus homomorphus CBS 101889]RAL12302.1 hypothetical protein BO97DRAFT_405643 [Aspergillus homomorphus CBS 101889]
MEEPDEIPSSTAPFYPLMTPTPTNNRPPPQNINPSRRGRNVIHPCILTTPPACGLNARSSVHTP